MRVSELPHMRELTVSLRDLALQLPHLGELPNPQKHWVFSQLPHFHFSGPGATWGWPSPSCLWHDTLACRLGCCLPVADVQHRPTRQRRPSAERSPLGTRTPRRESTAEALRRPGKALRCFPSFLLCAARLEGQVQGRTFFEKKAPQKTLRSLRSAPGADVRHSLAQARRSAAAPWRELRAQALGRFASLGLPLSLRHAIPPHWAYPSSPRAWPPTGPGWRRRWPSPWPCAPRPASG